MAKIKAGTKRQTVRPRPKRIPWPDDLIDCRYWSGRPYRSPQKAIGVYRIEKVKAVELTADHLKTGPYPLKFVDDLRALNRFARADGFKDYSTLWKWFADQYGQPAFRGILLTWHNHEATRLARAKAYGRKLARWEQLVENFAKANPNDPRITPLRLHVDRLHSEAANRLCP